MGERAPSGGVGPIPWLHCFWRLATLPVPSVFSAEFTRKWFGPKPKSVQAAGVVVECASLLLLEATTVNVCEAEIWLDVPRTVNLYDFGDVPCGMGKAFAMYPL